MCPDGRLMLWGSGRQAIEKQDVLCDWLGMHPWLSLLCPKLEEGTNLREAVTY